MSFLGIVLLVCPLMAQVDIAGTTGSATPLSRAIAATPTLSSAAVRPVAAYSGEVANPLKIEPNYKPEKSNGRTFYRWSVAALAAANVADTVSSWHHPESNRLLSSPGAKFEGRSLALKSAFVGTSFLIEYWTLRHNPAFYRPLGWLNFAIAGLLGGVAAYNTSLH